MCNIAKTNIILAQNFSENKTESKYILQVFLILILFFLTIKSPKLNTLAQKLEKMYDDFFCIRYVILILVLLFQTCIIALTLIILVQYFREKMTILSK
jgi:hypothetical protein